MMINSSLSVVIPTLNAAGVLAGCVAALQPGAGLICEVIIADGGSADGTQELVRAMAAKMPQVRLLEALPGRGGQMQAAIAVASGDYVMLLHADCVLAPDWPQAVAGLQPGKAGYFQFRLDSRHRWARVMECLVAWRCRLFELPYGDQGLVMSRNVLAQAGGMPGLPLMEDVALVRRLRGRLQLLAAFATSSATRYEQGGWLRRPMRNLFCLGLYFCGVAPERIRRIYG